MSTYVEIIIPSFREAGWNLQLPPAGQKLPQPQALFTKLEDKIVEEEMARLGSVGPA